MSGGHGRPGLSAGSTLTRTTSGLVRPGRYNSPMIDAETMHRVRELRDRGLTPNEIARNLAMRPAAVADVIRRLAAERDAANAAADLADCWLNTGWSAGLTIPEHPDWRDPGADHASGGLVTALVARRRRHRRGATVCVYLVDVYCLGVKNAMGPDNTNDQALRRLTDHVFSGYNAPPVPAPIELVRDLVLGATEYANGLGFDPHPDFEPTRAHLGPSTGPSAITFGHDGKPTYISGPYDDPSRVLRTLRHAVGLNGFHYTVAHDFGELRVTG